MLTSAAGSEQVRAEGLRAHCRVGRSVGRRSLGRSGLSDQPRALVGGQRCRWMLENRKSKRIRAGLRLEVVQALAGLCDDAVEGVEQDHDD